MSSDLSFSLLLLADSRMDEPIALTILREQPQATTSSLVKPSSSGSSSLILLPVEILSLNLVLLNSITASKDVHQEPVESSLNSQCSLLPRPVAKRRCVFVFLIHFRV